jgi:hypothetical protein
MPLAVMPQAFDHPDWNWEIKYDGFRSLACGRRPNEEAQPGGLLRIWRFMARCRWRSSTLFFLAADACTTTFRYYPSGERIAPVSDSPRHGERQWVREGWGDDMPRQEMESRGAPLHRPFEPKERALLTPGEPVLAACERASERSPCKVHGAQPPSHNCSYDQHFVG